MVAVLRRGPTRWSHVGRWDLAGGTYEKGGWLRARIFPRRSDLSPDGRFLCYFAHDQSATWEPGESYVALSKLPWLTALHAFGTCGTWTRGYHFTEGRGIEGSKGAELPIPYRLCPTTPIQFATELRRGWREAPDSPVRDPDDIWDQRRNARLRKPQPGGTLVLHVESLGWAGGEFGVDQAVDGLRVRYGMESGGGVELQEDLQWADWDRKGRLLAATRSGKLQAREVQPGRSVIVFEEDLSPMEPDPRAPPEWATRW